MRIMMKDEPTYSPADTAKLQAAIRAAGFRDISQAISDGHAEDLIEVLDDPGRMLAMLLAALDDNAKLNAGILVMDATTREALSLVQQVAKPGMN